MCYFENIFVFQNKVEKEKRMEEYNSDSHRHGRRRVRVIEKGPLMPCPFVCTQSHLVLSKSILSLSHERFFGLFQVQVGFPLLFIPFSHLFKV